MLKHEFTFYIKFLTSSILEVLIFVKRSKYIRIGRKRICTLRLKKDTQPWNTIIVETVV